MNRSTLLSTANGLVSSDRQDAYGPPDRNFALIAQRWSQFLGVDLEPWMVAYLMADLKLARIASVGKPHEDSLIDACGYLALAGELATDDR